MEENDDEKELIVNSSDIIDGKRKPRQIQTCQASFISFI
jgi:hypothetical protein